MEFKDLKFKVTWEVDDGYAGKSRPQHTTVKPSDDFTEEEWNEMDELYKKEYVDQMVQYDFDGMSFYVEDYGF